MVKSSQHTKEDSADPAKTTTIIQQRRSYENNAKALRRKKVSKIKKHLKLNLFTLIQNRKSKQDAKKERAAQELEQIKVEALAQLKQSNQVNDIKAMTDIAEDKMKAAD